MDSLAAMGFFDVYCQVSGVSSYGQDLEGVLLLDRDGRLSPLSVLVRGTSDRLGGIDGIRGAALVDRSFEALSGWIDEGRLTLDVPYDDLRSLAAYRKEHAFGSGESERRESMARIHGFEWLFSVLAYGTWNAAVALRFEGFPVRACLAVPQMIDAAAETQREAAAEDDPIEDLLNRAFDAGSAAREAHAKIVGRAGDKHPARRALVRLARLRAFLDARGGPREPAQDQDTDETNRAAAEAAFRALAHLPAFRRALAAMYPALLRERATELDRLDMARSQNAAARAYDPAGTYRAGELVAHPKFGEGVVLRNPEGGKVEIAFPSGARKLVCGR
ncbi:MAG: hypothetical protein QM820_00340 [Minicystis sp.]